MKTYFWKLIILASLLFCGTFVKGQVLALDELKPDSTNYANVYVKKLYSDSLSSSFAIWIKDEVKPHKHVLHTEVVTILDGKASMVLNGQTSKIKKGDVIIIPKGSVHSVKTLSRKPLLVISVQAPEFKGKDRIWVNE